MKISYRDFLKKIKEGEISKNILMLGEDNYLIKFAIEKIRKKIEGDFLFLWADEIKIDDILSNFSQVGLFSKSRVFVLAEVDKISLKERTKLAKYFDSSYFINYLILTAKSLLYNDPIYIRIIDVGWIVNLSRLSKDEFSGFVRLKLKEYKKTANDSFFDYIWENFKDKDLAFTISEVEKICIYKKEKGSLTKEDAQDVLCQIMPEKLLWTALKIKDLKLTISSIKRYQINKEPLTFPITVILSYIRQKLESKNITVSQKLEFYEFIKQIDLIAKTKPKYLHYPTLEISLRFFSTFL